MSLTIKNVYKSKDGRWRAYCVDKNSKPYIVSYPRILMEENLGRPLKPDEDVHHIDGNVDNNDINNLQVVKHGEHQREHSTKYVDTAEICQICGREFIMKGDKWARFYSDLLRVKVKRRGLTCSKSCAAKLGSGKYEQLYKIEDRLLEVEKFWKN